MEIFFLIILFIFWSLFWSFWSVIIYRLKSKEKWIMFWRSHCPKCNHKLNSLDLIPILSWILNFWKCKYCNEKISSIYLFLELSMWILFSLIWYFLIDFNLILNFDINEILKLIFWLFIWFITIIYTFYDILFLEIHEWIMFASILTSSFVIILQSFWLINIIPNLPYNNIWYTIDNYISIFIFIFSISILYLIMIKWLKEIYDIWLIIIILISLIIFNNYYNIFEYSSLNALIASLVIFIFFFLQILISKWAWLWWWDLRIAILIWILLWTNFILSWLFLTYFLWSIISIWVLIYQKLISKKINTQIPFGPFLALWFFTTIFFQENIINFTKIYF